MRNEARLIRNHVLRSFFSLRLGRILSYFSKKLIFVNINLRNWGSCRIFLVDINKFNTRRDCSMILSFSLIFVLCSEALLALPTLTGFKQEAPSPPNGEHGFVQFSLFTYLIPIFCVTHQLTWRFFSFLFTSSHMTEGLAIIHRLRNRLKGLPVKVGRWRIWRVTAAIRAVIRTRSSTCCTNIQVAGVDRIAEVEVVALLEEEPDPLRVALARAVPPA